MAEPYIGEIRPVAFNFAPTGWALCEGQTLIINQNAALYSLLRTYYGGDGQTNFKLPDLRGRVMMGVGRDSSGTSYSQGQAVGTATVTLQPTQIPAHSHDVLTASDIGTKVTPASNYLATVPTTGANAYVTAPTQSSQQASMNPNMVASSGSSAPHLNMQPYTTINYIIALQGYYPPRDN
ncbi:MAG TPA: phage tail protein [Magnetococcales bacterium]|nr:phage tail protein [Magnetococcales bacterium]